MRDNNNKDVVVPSQTYHQGVSSQIASLNLPIINRTSSSSSCCCSTTTALSTTISTTTTTTNEAIESIIGIRSEIEDERIIGGEITLSSLSTTEGGGTTTVSYMDMDQKPPTFQDYSTTNSGTQQQQQQQSQPQSQQPPPPQQSLYSVVGPSNCYSNPLQSSTSTVAGSNHDFTRGSATTPMSSYFYQNSFPTSASAAVAVAAAATVSGTPYGTGATCTATHFMYHQQSVSSPEGKLY